LDGGVGDAGERAVADPDVLDAAAGQAAQLDGERRALDGQAVHVDVLHHRVHDRALARPGEAVVHVDEDAALALRAAGEVADVHAVDEATPALVRLDVHGVEGGVRRALGDRVVLGEHVADPAGHLAADRDRAPSTQELVVLDHDVLARYADPPAVRVPPRLDDDAVVTGVELATADVHVLAGFQVAAVDHAAPGEDRDVADRDVLRQDRVQVPHGRVLQVNVLDEHVRALVQLHEVGLEEVAHAVDPLAHGNVV